MAPPIPDRSGAPDAEIVRLVKEGETDAFAELVRRTHRPAYRLAYRITQDPRDADHALRESYVTAYRTLHRFHSPRVLGPWMLTIVARTALDLPPRPAQAAATPLDEKTGVERAFAGLPEEHRAIIALRVEGDLPYAEIAGVLGIPAGMVMPRLAHAREALLEGARKVEGGPGKAPVNDEALHPPRVTLFAYRDGELPGEKRVLTEAHVVGCTACRTLIDDVSGIEAALKRAVHEAAGDTYEQLSAAVLVRLAEGIPEVGCAVVAKPELAAIERRRGDDDPRGDESGRIGAPPRLPWAAIAATASAAAAVLVVVFLLVRQGAIRRAGPSPEPAVEEQETPAKTTRVAAPSDSVAPAPEAKAKPEPVPPPKAPAAAAAADRASGLVGGQGAGSTPGAYSALLRRFGLPPIWTEGVGTESVERAEPELRYLYQSGRADTDSARVRLYLAEAARLRYVPGQDSILYWKIARHYRRAIRLDGPDGDVGMIARERLGTLQP